MNFVLLLLIGLNFIAIYGLRSVKNSRGVSQRFSYSYDKEALDGRRAEYPIHPLILSRRSLRVMSGEEMTNEELFPLFEAARWAPSTYNIQEWRFVYAKRNTRHWKNFLQLLTESNQKWASDSAVLIVLLSKKFNTHKGKKTLTPTHSFDTGAAWMAMALEGTARGYVVHAMGGFDKDRAARTVRVANNPDYNVEVMIAIGKKPDFKQRSGTPEKTTLRNSIHEFISEGVFTEKVNN